MDAIQESGHAWNSEEETGVKEGKKFSGQQAAGVLRMIKLDPINL